MKEDDDGPPAFFVNLQEQFIQKCLELGLDVMDVKDFLEDKGIPEISYETVLDHIKN